MSLPIVLGVSAMALAAGVWLWRSVSLDKRARQQELAEKTQELEQRSRASLETESKYRKLFETVPVAIIVANMDGTLIDINQAAVEIFGFQQRDEVMALNLRSMFVNPADSDRRFGKAVAADRVESKEFLMRRKDGTTFAALTRTQIVRKPDGSASHIEGFVTDISDYKRLEADRRAMEHEQRISARLQSVGALAAGIAHEINTPMQFVSDSVYFLKSAMGELKPIWPVLTCISKAGIDKEIANSVQYIKEALLQIDIDDLVIDANQSADRALEGIRRISTIIRAMREFAHPDNGEHSNVDINKAIETTLTVCKNVYKEIADVKTELSPMPPVLCQFGEINQVLLNIVVNAAHAIEARKSEVEKGLIRISTEVEETWAVIRIQDNGTGIPESVKTRIFDPFFTTKEVGKGTGQGLAIVQSVIVERHRGRISVDSEVGKGTTFTLRLPLTPRNTEAVGVENEQEA